MPDRRRTTCRNCNRNRDEVGPISWTGKCERCAVELASENVLSLIDHHGEGFNRWRRGMVASVGGVLLDDQRQEE
jgi:hypothetical protein